MEGQAQVVAGQGGQGGQGGQPAQAGQSWTSMLSSLVRTIFIVFLFRSFLGGKQEGTTSVNNQGEPKEFSKNAVWDNLYRFDDPLVLKIYVTENEFHFEEKDLVWAESSLVYGDLSPRSFSWEFIPSENLLNNGSIFAHITITNESPRIKQKDLSSIVKTKRLNRYAPKKKTVSKKNLLTGEQQTQAEIELQEVEAKKVEIISYWYTNLTLSLVTDQTRWQPSNIPPQVREVLEFDESGKHYYPNLYFNDFWLLQEDLFPLNKTIKKLDLHIHYEPLSLFFWQMMSQFDKSLENQASMGLSEGNPDEFKRLLRDTNPFLLGLTFVVTLLHSVFDFLAFRNDINFWRNKKSMEGLSLRTIFVNVFFQAVIFLYLVDNETSFVILISSGIGLLIEAWKISKAMIVSIDAKGSFPYISLKEKKTYKKKTKEYDELAFRYLSWVAFPLLFAYSVYSLIYNEHKSWYSFILNTLVGFVYTFGFIMMTPQLFINYKLKSVAHMPWKTFMYKALNTFIDDLFAFIIKMPLLHRLACLRDDLIFFVYLYQRWIYPVDNRRANEFGQVGEGGGDEDDETDEIEHVEKKEDTLKIEEKEEEKKEEEKEEEEKEEEEKEEEEKEKTNEESKEGKLIEAENEGLHGRISKKPTESGVSPNVPNDESKKTI